MTQFFSSRTRRVALALQGGGAHGAFTWGVLDRLLEAGLEFHCVTGVSSGAMIGAMAVQGMVKNGREGARAAMGAFWNRVMESHIFGNLPPSPLDWMWDTTRALGNGLAWTGLTQALRLFDPAQLNPLGQNPLAPLLADLLDRAAIRDPAAPRLYVGATDVETGEVTIFDNDRMRVRVLLASACIPMMFPAVEIEGRHYWDGGYSCNPPLAPVLAHDPDLLVLIRAQPLRRQGVPVSTADIIHRLHEIAFQAPLAAELSLLPRGIRLVDIPADEALTRHPLTSKLNTDRPFLEALFAAGREAGTAAEARIG
ncbi:patatin-like phospholipase family protein [Acidocella sp.]|uniref:patatin-like phospholipase family protein n=1 Tax=Acidocella sp. TaxID=50710 RepID=UPI002627C416|nr:patatin-like phospholipase family protein [Acidocella sp.]